MTKLILIRHGLSETNEKKILAGHLDTPLAEKGIHQAEITAQYVCEKYKVDAIYSSDLKRAKMTAEKIADITKKDIVISENLRELFAGEWEGKKSKDLPILYPEQYYLWINDIGKSHCEGGETIQQLYDRINNEIDKIISENQSKTVVIVSHATAIRAFMASLNYFAFSTISATRQFLSLLSFLVSTILTVSPTPHSLFSSCALIRLLVVMVFL